LALFYYGAMYSLRTLPASLLAASSSSVSAPVRAFHAARQAAAAAPAAQPVKMTKVNVDGKDVEVPSGYTVLQACEAAGATIPRFCYHDRLSIAGNCRMCLVEVEKSPKPVASCAMPLMPNMRIKTTTPLVKKAREGVMEFLLANHPLDCPICDQGGECDLQDQSMQYGTDRSRLREYKRTVEDKNLGPLVKTTMTRCIHCTRCIRFSTEVAGVNTLGTTGRGNAMEIGTYVDKLLDTELSGNVIDLCPVGALTSKPYAFTARPWELLRHESIDVHDALNAHIRVDTRGPEVMRILPRLNEELNEEWLADKSRFSYDGLKRQRLDQPMVKTPSGEFKPVTWVQALQTIASKIKAAKGSEVLGMIGEMVDAEAIIAFKDFLNRLGSSNMLHVQQASTLSPDVRSEYLFNSTVLGIEDADAVLLVGTNPRMESPLIASRIRKIVKRSRVPVFNIGPEADLAIDHVQVGNSTQLLMDLANGKSSPVQEALAKAERPLVVVGMGALQVEGGAAAQAALTALKSTFPNLVTSEWNGINMLHTAASRAAALELGFVPGVHAGSSPLKVVYLMGSEEILDRSKLASDAFIIYQGHHGDAGAEQADIVLPSPAYTEKSGTYMNMEGRVQRTNVAVGRLANARDDWAIIRALSEVVGLPLPYNTLEQVRARLADVSPVFATYDQVETTSFQPKRDVTKSVNGSVTFQPYLSNYFMTDAISRASKTMAKCSAQLPTARNSYIQPTQQANAEQARQQKQQQM